MGAGAWEIAEIRRNRVMLALIYPNDWKVSLDWSGALNSLVMPPESRPIKVGGYPYGPARNQCVKVFLESGFGWLFFLDSDVLCPAGTVMRLLDTGRDYIGALYHQRFPPYQPAAFMKGVAPAIGPDGKQLMGPDGKTPQMVMTRQPLPAFRFGDIVPVDLLPTGATLISRRCVEAVMTRYAKPFEWTLDIDRAAGLSEDYDFSLKAASVGFQAWLHTGIECKHEMLAYSGVRGLEAPVVG